MVNEENLLKLIIEKIGLNKTSLKVLESCSEYTYIRDLVVKLKKDRTTIQKIVQSLVKNSYLDQRQKNMNRGFCFCYKDTGKFSKVIKKEIEETKNELEKIDDFYLSLNNSNTNS